MLLAPILNDATIIAALKQAWNDSLPGITGGHEEGGFVLKDSDANLNVYRWPQGLKNSIAIPAHNNCKFDSKEIVATFHTHPNIGTDHQQEPSETDKRSVRDDIDLKGEFYEGELVISEEIIYLVSPNGRVNEVGFRRELFGE